MRSAIDADVLGGDGNVHGGGVGLEDRNLAVLQGAAVGLQDSLPHADEAEAAASRAGREHCTHEKRKVKGETTVVPGGGVRVGEMR